MALGFKAWNLTWLAVVEVEWDKVQFIAVFYKLSAAQKQANKCFGPETAFCKGQNSCCTEQASFSLKQGLRSRQVSNLCATFVFKLRTSKGQPYGSPKPLENQYS